MIFKHIKSATKRHLSILKVHTKLKCGKFSIDNFPYNLFKKTAKLLIFMNNCYLMKLVMPLIYFIFCLLFIYFKYEYT